jgi:hypothetical protein
MSSSGFLIWVLKFVTGRAARIRLQEPGDTTTAIGRQSRHHQPRLGDLDLPGRADSDEVFTIGLWNGNTPLIRNC